MMVTRSDIQQEVRSWLGAKWRHQGRSRTCGIDCAGLVLEVSKSLGLLPQDYDEKGYGRRALGYDFLQIFKDRPELTEVDSRRPEVGDILIFADKIYPCHCGIATSKWDIPYFIHAHAARGIVIEEAYPWKLSSSSPKFAIASFRFKEVTG